MAKTSIQIISGTYGHREEGVLLAKTAKSAPFLVDIEEGKRLVGLGVATFSGETPTVLDIHVDPGDTTPTLEETLAAMDKLDDLKAFAAAEGIEMPTSIKSKASARSYILEELSKKEKDTEKPEEDALEEVPDLSGAGTDSIE